MKKILLCVTIIILTFSLFAYSAGYYGTQNALSVTGAATITSGTIDDTTIGDLTTLNTIYVDKNRTDSYTADGGISRPYKTVLAALTVINADPGKSWILKAAPGDYTDNLTITGPRSLRIEGAGVTLSGTILINSGVGSYDRIEFVGVEGGRAEKGPAMTISGKITATRTNDSLIYVGFHGCLITGQFEATTSGTWVLQYENCRVNGAITGTLAVNTQLDNTILIEAYGFNEFVGAITGIVSFYNVNGADIYSTINTTPWFENRFTHTSFAGSVSMIPQGAAISKVIYVDDISYKSLAARTPTLTGATYSHLQGTMAIQNADSVNITGGNIIGITNLTGSNITGNVTGDVSGNADTVDGSHAAAFQAASATLSTLAGITYQTFMQTLFGAANETVARATLGLGAANDVQFTNITGTLTGTATGLAGTPNITVGTVSATTLTGDGSGITGINASNVDGMRTDSANASSVPCIDSGGNIVSCSNLTDVAYSPLAGSSSLVTLGTINTGGWNGTPIPVANGGTGAANAGDARTNLGLGNVATQSAGAGLVNSGTDLTVRQLVSTVFADTDAAITVSISKKGYVVPSLYNGASVSTMTCSVYDLNAANDATIINLTKSRAGSLTSVFDTGVNIANTDYTATSTGVNATGAALLTGDILLPNVTAAGGTTPKGLSCTFMFAL